ncbi:hypothetical protein KC19_VG335700 [Ceratodon purpureus]|uniref:Uncharacterized protein n=1 Tax=Ceratodon purpureus TaxID=3225 RepID=A0A8T0HW15_CERPU|nr:hypothetical protein KC19_VG335700 [Ceratodon purpureus]
MQLRLSQKLPGLVSSTAYSISVQFELCFPVHFCPARTLCISRRMQLATMVRIRFSLSSSSDDEAPPKSSVGDRKQVRAQYAPTGGSSRNKAEIPDVRERPMNYPDNEYVVTEVIVIRGTSSMTNDSTEDASVQCEVKDDPGLRISSTRSSNFKTGEEGEDAEDGGFNEEDVEEEEDAVVLALVNQSDDVPPWAVVDNNDNVASTKGFVGSFDSDKKDELYSDTEDDGKNTDDVLFDVVDEDEDDLEMYEKLKASTVTYNSSAQKSDTVAKGGGLCVHLVLDVPMQGSQQLCLGRLEVSPSPH